MIKWDPTNKQVLSSECRRCPDPYFAPYDDGYLHVGCCSYSPVFGLFEIYKMIKAGDRVFFLEKIYKNKMSTVQDLTITVQAYVHPMYDHLLTSRSLSPQELEDVKLRFSVCSFFVKDSGCGLQPAYKNSTCRSFICTTIEEKLNIQQQTEFSKRVREIRREVDLFEQAHKARIKQKGWSFQNNMEEILNYLDAIE